MGLDGLKCNICMICFTESHEKDIRGHTRGQHQLFIYAYSKTEITVRITIKNVYVHVIFKSLDFKTTFDCLQCHLKSKFTQK